MTIQEKRKIINKVNTRISRSKKFFESKGYEMDFFEDTLVPIRKMEGISMSSPYRISTKKSTLENIDDKILKQLEEKVLTTKELRTKAEEYIKAAYEEDIDLSDKSDKDIQAMASAVIKVYASYGDALGDYYEIEQNIDLDAIIDEEVKYKIQGLLMQIDHVIHARGKKSVDTIEENKKLIGDLAGKIEAIKKGQ